MFWMKGITIWRWTVAFCWYGWRGWSEPHRWGVVGVRYPDVYAGPVKFIWGPAPT